MFFELITWWYGAGWLAMAERVKASIVGLVRQFSVPILLATLFSPWKRIVALPGRSFDQKLRGAVDNLVSRAVGFVVRSLVLITVGVLAIIASVIGLVILLCWPLLPIGLVYCLIKAVSS